MQNSQSTFRQLSGHLHQIYYNNKTHKFVLSKKENCIFMLQNAVLIPRRDKERNATQKYFSITSYILLYAQFSNIANISFTFFYSINFFPSFFQFCDISHISFHTFSCASSYAAYLRRKLCSKYGKTFFFYFVVFVVALPVQDF